MPFIWRKMPPESYWEGLTWDFAPTGRIPSFSKVSTVAFSLARLPDEFRGNQILKFGNGLCLRSEFCVRRTSIFLELDC
jgi:hypothetical protein